MLQRFLTIVDLPELRPDSIQSDKGIPELEVFIPIDVYWEIQEIIKNMRFARVTGLTIDHYWREFNKRIYPCLIFEKDRIWFKNNIG